MGFNALLLQCHYYSMFQFFKKLSDDLVNNGLGKWQETLPSQLESVFSSRTHGKMQEWQDILTSLPEINTSDIDLTTAKVRIGQPTDCDDKIRIQLEGLLQKLHPWRKGPYDLFGIHIDTEWHSDWKWDRIQPHISPLKNRSVLDVGCGNGYHMWRMLGEGARLVIGADPSQFFLIQFQLMKKYAISHQKTLPIHLLPFKAEELPAFNYEYKGRGFDSVFSMGVLYHRISPIHHLQELKSFLRPGGELILETLIIENDSVGNNVLIPKDRYAKMRNVWFIPTTELLIRMMQRAGFINCKVVDVNQTSIEEQRTTDWMRYESLPDFLDPADPNKSIEGYPAPLRATIIASTPA